ncbi:MAG TPA: hypothetical protein VNT26_00630, partial [Candidatus Sulfotelmatobacter sp.]|nr:hypothetical protein [Candidatus Sulfotelmatobacter sp.]
MIALVGLGALMLLPALARTQPGSKALQCQNNLRQLTVAWRAWAEDNSGQLLTCSTQLGTRTNWMTGFLDFSSSSGNWDPGVDIMKSPLWPYLSQQAQLFKCPADQSTVATPFGRKPRVRSVSMSQVFGTGEWLDGTFTGGSSLFWMTYGQLSKIR